MRTWLAAAVLLLIIFWVLAGPTAVRAQQQGGGAARPARDAAPIDLTGYWVAYVTENWRYRMVTPAKGEYRRIPASPAAVPLINAWDPAADERAGNQCKSYGAGAIMSVPGRLHITWQDADGPGTRRARGSRACGTAFPPASARDHIGRRFHPARHRRPPRGADREFPG
nr:hypothetical protein Hi04_10k_c1889_00010 [uncultured bacterium]